MKISKLQKIISVVAILLIVISVAVWYFLTQYVYHTAENWHNPAWLYRKSFQIEGGLTDKKVKNFPLVFSLQADTDLVKIVDDFVSDVILVDYQGNILKYKLNSYDPQTGEVKAVVFFPILKQNDVFYMYYADNIGDKSAGNYNYYKNNYSLVMSMDDNKKSKIKNNVNNKFEISKGNIGKKVKQGVVGSALSFDGSNNYIELDRRYLDLASGAVTFWIKQKGEFDQPQSILLASTSRISDGFGAGPRQRDFHVGITSNLNLEGKNNNILFNYEVFSDNFLMHSNRSLKKNKWNYVAVSWDLEQQFASVYLNGELRYSKKDLLPVDKTLLSYMYIGKTFKGIRHFNGQIDEMRFAKNSLSAEYIKLEYENTLNYDNQLKFTAQEIEKKYGIDYLREFFAKE